MREQLIQYVNLLFAGNDDVEEIKQEILQNTLDRYDDLVFQGKSPEAAYRLAISGIGDINEIITGQSAGFQAAPNFTSDPNYESSTDVAIRTIRAVAICLYIISPIPLFLFSRFGWDEVGLCGTLLIVAAATALLLIFKKKGAPVEEASAQTYADTPERQHAKKKMKRSINSMISTLGLVLYFVISFATKAWYITWLIFPIIGAVNGVVNAAMDLKEGN